MSDLTYKVSVDVAQAMNAFGSLEKKLIGLKTAVAGIGFLAFARNAFQAADSMVDLSNSTGLAITSIIELQYAMEAAGGRLDQVNTSVIKFGLSVDEAAQGSQKLQQAFGDLGISLEELGTLSEDQLLREVAKGFLEIEDKSRRAALANDIFGKSIRGVDIKQFSEEILNGTGKYDQYAKSVEKAAELQGKLDRALIDLRLAFLTVIEPLVSFIENLKASEGGVEKLTTLIRALTVAIAVLAGGALFRSIVALVGTLGRAWVAIQRLVGSAKAAKEVKKLGGSFDEASAAGSKAATVIKDKFAANSPLMKALRGAGMLLGGVIGAVTGISLTSGAEEKPASDAAANQAEENAKREVAAQREVINALKEKITTIQQVGTAYAQQNKELISSLENEAKYLQMSDQEAEIQKALDDLYKRTASTIQGLQDQKAKLTDKDKEQKKAIDETITSINNQARADAERIKIAIENLQKEREAIDARNRAIEFGETIRQDTASLQAMQAEIDMLYLTTEERTKYQRKLDAERNLKERLAAIDLEAAKVGKNATASQIADYENRRKAAIDYYNGVLEKNKELQAAQDDEARKIKVWGEETKKALEDSISPSNQVKSFWDGLSGQIDNFAKTGKFKIKEFLAGVIQDFIAAKLKLAALDFLKSIGLGGGGGLFGGAIIPGFLAGGGNAEQGKPYIVGEKGPELFVPPTAGRVVPNHAMSSGAVSAPVTNNYITNNISALDAKSVAELFAQNRKTLLGTVKLAEKELPYMA